MKSQFKNILGIAMLALASLSLAAPSNAHAVLVIDTLLVPFHLAYGEPLYSGVDIDGDFDESLFACLIAAPVCLLDQKVDGVSGMTKQDLLDNGVTAPGKPDQYIRENKELVQALAQQHERLVVGETDTNESLSTQLRSIDPKLTDDFVKFYVGQALLTAKK